MRWMAALLLGCLLYLMGGLSSQAETPVHSWYIEGQVHPAYELKVTINDSLNTTVVSDDNKLKIFMYALDEAALKDGANTIQVTEKIIQKIDQDVGTDRSWRFNVRYQSDMTRPETAEKLLTVVGQEAPFPEVGHTETKTFAFPKYQLESNEAGE